MGYRKSSNQRVAVSILTTSPIPVRDAKSKFNTFSKNNGASKMRNNFEARKILLKLDQNATTSEKCKVTCRFLLENHVKNAHNEKEIERNLRF